MYVMQQQLEAGVRIATGPSALFRPQAHDAISFPESRFEAPAARREAYRATVASGYQSMKRQRAVIAGLARNVEWILEHTMGRIERMGSLFGDYRVVIYENDSEDNTLDILHRWSHANRRVIIISERRHEPVNYPIRCLRRAERMAYYRNQYRQLVEDRFANFDAILVVDTDLAEGWSYDGIAHSFGLSQWDFMGSYGILYKRIGLQTNRMIHFDSWAFRHVNDYRPLPNRAVNHMKWSRGDALVPVGSCFGGLGVYRMPAFLAARYDGEDAEHVGLHRGMVERGFDRLFLNPSQIALYGRRHRKLDGVVQWWQRLAAISRFCPLAVWY